MRPVWFVCGLLALGLAILGIFLPLLPTTPLVILSAWFMARSSQRLHDWLLAHRLFGPIIADWQRHGAIPRWAKRLSVAMMAAAFALSLWLGLAPWLLATQAAVLLAGAAFVLTRPDGPG
jgi:uncharacterized membrane protein YbaN (DUF454 family)